MSIFTLPNRIVHIDFHTLPGIGDVGSEFDAEAFADTLAGAGVECVTVFAKCNLGCAYYPTRIGMPHPSMKIDLLGESIEACHRRGMKVIAYFNAGLDHEQALRHREWCKLHGNGQTYHRPEIGPFFRRMCLQSGYGQFLFDMVEEVLTKYPVDGLFFDCFQNNPCYGIECVSAMKAEGIDVFNEIDATDFAHRVNLKFAERIRQLIDRRRPGAQVFFNFLEYRMQPTHLEIEVLPQGEWGYDYLPWTVRYVRTLGKPYLMMTGRFQGTWGDMGGIRPAASLAFDCYYAIANGAVCSVGDHMHPRGKLDDDVYALIGRTFERITQLQPWTANAKSVAEIAVLEPAARRFPGYDFDKSSVAGAVRMLVEAKYQCDVIDGDGDLDRYRVVILPDHVLVDTVLAGKLRAFVQSGGSIVSSGTSGLTPDQSRFALEEYQVEYAGLSSWDRSFFRVGERVGRDLPRLPIAIYDKRVDIKPKGQCQSLCDAIDPYVNLNAWDWEHAAYYIPPDRVSQYSALVRSGNICHFSFPIFKGYFERADIAFRTLLRNCLELVLPQPMIRAENLPSFAQVTVMQQPGRVIVHVVQYVPEVRGRSMAIEEPIISKNVRLSLRRDGRNFVRSYLAPTQLPLAMDDDDVYVRVTVPEINGYQMIVFEQ